MARRSGAWMKAALQGCKERNKTAHPRGGTMGPMSHATPEPHTTSRVLLIRPAAFGANPETATTNSFQSASGSSAAVRAKALAEFDALVQVLGKNGVEVFVGEDTPAPEKPDAVFPNNWVSFHPGGKVVLYPMQAPSRRSEVRLDLLGRLEARGAITPRTQIDLRPGAEHFGYLEGTGSLVLDRARRIAYACLSPRTSARKIGEFCAELAYTPELFHATDAAGRPVYHTNVMLAVGTAFALLCSEALADERERARIEERLTTTGHELVRITRAQMGEFAGNVLELASKEGEPLIVLSARARRALAPAQLELLERHGRLVSVELDTIERHGGGSARCMIAELF